MLAIGKRAHVLARAGLTAVLWAAGWAAVACEAVNFKTLPLPAGPAPLEIRALIGAYPYLRWRAGDRTILMPDGTVLPLGGMRDIPPEEQLKAAHIAEQFLYVYPLEFDLETRRTPWADPGRLRNDAFFRALYFDDRKAARRSLATVTYDRGVRARFQMTTKHNVDCQLRAVFAALATVESDLSPYFRKTGGSFNWRTISGTERLSAHSFGIALDLNTELGGYWKWSGAAEGQAADYDNRMPQVLVETFETYGFIWGGKWHHFDGMHFEYRPELILHARLAGGG